MTTIYRTSLLALAVAASPFFASPAAAQQAGYWVDGRGAVVKDPYNLCWRTSYWTPALANIECDPDLVPRAAPVAAPVPPAAPPKPAPPVAAPKPVPVPVAKPKRCDATVTFAADEYFAFGKTTLGNPAVMRPRIEKEVRQRLNQCATLEAIIVEGHTDRIGSQQANQKLSEQRAEAAKEVLIKDLGVPANKIETLGMGKTLPVKSCPDAEYKTQAALIACLAPNRRVVINIRGVGK
ncbi:MAG TPA: OmpA family protein [Burkholderiales bacterium]|nr:OmpA family protein [Burkholderiales bacterium]